MEWMRRRAALETIALRHMEVEEITGKIFGPYSTSPRGAAKPDVTPEVLQQLAGHP